MLDPDKLEALLKAALPAVTLRDLNPMNPDTPAMSPGLCQAITRKVLQENIRSVMRTDLHPEGPERPSLPSKRRA